MPTSAAIPGPPYDQHVLIKTRRHLTSIRYAITVALEKGEASPEVGDTMSLGDMAVVRVVALRDETRRRAGDDDDRERSMTVETLETIGRLPNVQT
jgi:hypothetical protein